MSILRSKIVVIGAVAVTILLMVNTARMLAPLIEALDTPPVDEAKIAQGIEVYLASYCGACHTLDAAETRGTFAPAHNNMAQLAQEHLASDSYIGQATTIEEYIRESILEPQVYLVPDYVASSHAMPPFTHLSEEDLDVLVYMLAQQNTTQ